MHTSKSSSNISGFSIIESPLHELVLSIGVPPNIYGFEYIIHAVELLMLDPSYQHYITKGLYVDIAKKFGTTPSKVERAIRHAINVTWVHGNTELIDHIFHHCVRTGREVPSNSVFLARLYYHVKYRLDHSDAS